MTTKPKGVMIKGMDMPFFCDQCPFAEKAIKRTEAIKRMVKALYDKYEVRCNSDDCPNEGPICEGCPIWEKYEKMAEAALDALITEVK